MDAKKAAWSEIVLAAWMGYQWVLLLGDNSAALKDPRKVAVMVAHWAGAKALC